MSVDVTAAGCCTPTLRPEIDPDGAARLAALAKALGDPVRVQIVDVLRQHPGEVCQCELSPLFDIAQPTLSHHLRKLADADLVTVERRGKWAYYSLDPATVEVLRSWLS
jgi:ArsR family transcriptional regulator